jgi:hypothetical protein
MNSRDYPGSQCTDTSHSPEVGAGMASRGTSPDTNPATSSWNRLHAFSQGSCGEPSTRSHLLLTCTTAADLKWTVDRRLAQRVAPKQPLISTARLSPHTRSHKPPPFTGGHRQQNIQGLFLSEESKQASAPSEADANDSSYSDIFSFGTRANDVAHVRGKPWGTRKSCGHSLLYYVFPLKLDYESGKIGRSLP